MSGRVDIDGLVTDWLNDEAPPRAPRAVLATALERVADVGQEGPIGLGSWAGRSPGLRWAVLGAVLAAALVGAIAGAGAVLFREASVPPSGIGNGWVAFTREGRGRQTESDIWLVRTGVDEFRLTGSDTDDGREVCPQFSPDGTRLAYVEGPAGPATDAGNAVVIVTLDASGRPAGPEIRVPMASWWVVCPKWSPDGQAVALLESGSTLWTARLDGTVMRIGGFATATNTMSQISWSPDGRAIAAADAWGSGVWIMPVDGSGPRVVQRVPAGVELSPGPSYEGPHYSPDGTRLAVPAQGASGPFLLVYRVDDQGAPVQLDGGDVFAWSPTGHELAYVRGAVRAGVERAEIAVAGFDGTDDRVIASGPPWVRGLTWSPDGTQVLYVADRGGVSGQLMVVSAAGGVAPVALTQPGNSFEYTTSDDISWQAVRP